MKHVRRRDYRNVFFCGRLHGGVCSSADSVPGRQRSGVDSEEMEEGLSIVVYQIPCPLAAAGNSLV